MRRRLDRPRWTRLPAAVPSFIECAVYLVLWGSFAWLKITAISGKAPIYSGDKRIWATIAEAPLFSREFLLARRPLFYPLLFKTGLTDEHIVWVQVALSILSTGVLAYAITRLVSRIHGPAIFAATLALGLVTPANVWDLMIRAESTSNSLLALSIGFLLLLADSLTIHNKWAYAHCIAIVALTVSAAFARDTNPYILLLILPTATPIVWSGVRRSVNNRRAPRRLVAGVAICLTVAALGARWSARAAPRYDFPLMNVIFKRVLPNPEKRAYFVHDLGMPLSRELMSRAGKFASSSGRYAYREPKLEPFRVWIFTRGYEAYETYLTTHFAQTALEAYAEFPSIAGYAPTREGRASSTAVTEVLDQWLVLGVLRSHPLAACLTFLLLAASAIFHHSFKTKVLSALTAFSVFATLTQLYVCFHGDSMEVGRHSVTVGIFLRLAMVTSVAVVLNLIVDTWQYVKGRRQRFARNGDDVRSTASEPTVA